MGQEEEEMNKLEIKKLVLGMVSTNCYIVSNQETKEAIVIDPADEAGRIVSYIRNEGLELKAILLTHGHFDHISAIPELTTTYPVHIYCHEREKEVCEDPAKNLSGIMGRKEVAMIPQVLLRDEQQIELIGCKIKVLYTPGHTQGGVCYYFPEEKILFSGDTLFMESVGRTDFPTGNPVTLIRSIQEKLFVLADDVKVYCGHGPSTSIGYEKRYNPFA